MLANRCNSTTIAPVVMAYMGLNRLDEAKAILNQALERKLNPLGNHLQLAAIAWVQNDAAEMEKHLEEAIIEAIVLNKSRAVEDAVESVKMSQAPIAVLISALCW